MLIFKTPCEESATTDGSAVDIQLISKHIKPQLNQRKQRQKCLPTGITVGFQQCSKPPQCKVNQSQKVERS
jgi:hypothetical protein